MSYLFSPKTVWGSFFLVIIIFSMASAEPVSAPSRTETFKIYSKTLDEEREIYVLAPEGFDPNNEGYTTIYVLDGEWSFPLVSSYFDYLSRWHRIPNVVVTGVRNVDRNRDYVFAEDRNFPGSGGSDKFAEFLENEWAPLIEEKFNGNGRRVLIGHSFGGSFTLYSLMTDPGFFDAYIAIGSSTWVANRGLFGLADEFLETSIDENIFLYMGVAEADGGATVPDGIAFAEKLDANPMEGLETYFEIIDETNHFTAVTPALFSAVEKLYPVWGMDKEVEDLILNKGADALDTWFEEQEASLDFRFIPPKMELEFMAIDMARESHGEAAEAIINNLLAREPKSFTSLFALGFVYYHQGKFQEGIEPFEKAAEYAREAGEAPTQIARYERAAENLRERLKTQEEEAEK
ncbi:MAG: alpha/beta hydrolase-fold protein [Alphaproteobacteria bacterium]